MKPTFSWFLGLFLLTALACGQSVAPFPDPTLTPKKNILGSGQTAYGFFPTPPQISLESIFAHYQNLSAHADFVLVQEPIPWQDFLDSPQADSSKIEDLKNARQLAQAHNLEQIFVVDPLNGLNRREFSGLPAGWEASFANPKVRAAFKNYTLRLLREFHPLYLGLASEINTYAEAYPADFANYLSLYRETYAAIKAESPQTQVFVTFQWEQLRGLAGEAEETTPGEIRWQQVEVFEPLLDLWAISSYPFIVYRSGAEIPADYYTPLLTRTAKPLAVAEGGFVSRPTKNLPGTPQDQLSYLQAIDSQLQPRLAFWVYLLLSDLDEGSYKRFFQQQGVGSADINTLGFFVSTGLMEKDGKTPKPALALWDSFRQRR